MSICQGAWETKILSAAVEIELFTRISRGANTVEKISQESGINVKLLQMLVNACKAMGLLKGTGDAIRNSPESEEFLVNDKEGCIGDFIKIVGGEYYDVWRSFKDVVMVGKPVRDDRVVRLSNPRYAELYLKAMHGITYRHAKEVAKLLNLKGKKSLLDIGGGQGTYSVMIAKENPGLRGVVFDSPFSCDAAKRFIDTAGAKNVTTQGGDFVMGSIPKGSDVVMLTHVLQSLAPERCESLLKKVFEVLPKGGMVIVNEFRLEKDGTNPIFSSLFALNAFMLSNGGLLHPHTEIAEWLSNVGFQEVGFLKTSYEFLVSFTATRM